MRRNIFNILNSFFFIFALACNVSAATYTINASDSGFYIVAGDHDSTVKEYFTTELSIYSGPYRSFFVFDLPSLSVTERVVSATLNLSQGVANGAGDFSLFDVSTDITALSATQSDRWDIFNDLGTGSKYGSVDYVYQTGGIVSVTLESGAFLTDINNSLGFSIALGGTYTPLPQHTGGFLFSGTGTNSTRQLILETAPAAVPIPGAVWLLGAGLIGLVGIQKKRQTA